MKVKGRCNLSICFIGMYGESEDKLHHCWPWLYFQGQSSITLWIGGQVGPRVSLFAMVIKLTNSVALVRERTIPTEQLSLVSDVSDNFCG
jgi:hypothetical protein